MRSLEDAAQRLAYVRVKSATDKTRSCTTSPQKNQTPDDEQTIQKARKLDEDQEPESGAIFLPIEEMDISSPSGKTKSNRNSVISKTSSVRRVLRLELKSLKEQKELHRCSEELKRKGKQSEIADLQEEETRKTRMTEKKLEFAKASSSRETSFRNLSPVWSPEDSLTKVSVWMNRTETIENLAKSLNVPLVLENSSVPSPANAEKSVNEKQFSARQRN